MISDDNTYKRARLATSMPGILINTRVPKELHDSIKGFAKEAGYGGVQEFAREALREHLRRQRLEWGLQELEKLRGSVKEEDIRILTPKERDALAMRGPHSSSLDTFVKDLLKKQRTVQTRTTKQTKKSPVTKRRK